MPRIKKRAWQKDLEDDSERVVKYYQKLFANYKNKDVLNAITEVLNAWSEIVRSSEFSLENQALFEKALRHSHEHVWFDAGSRLVRLLPHTQDAERILRQVFGDTKWRSRFNVVALSGGFDDELAYGILSRAINDASARVRQKVAGMVLLRQDRRFLHLVEERLEIEKTERAAEEMRFAIEQFDQVRRGRHGNLIFTVTSG